MKFNQMDEFEIDEISSVDRPAQAPALALITKSDNPEAIKVTDSDGNKYTVIKVAEQDLADSSGNSPKPAGFGGGPNGEIPMTKTAEEIAAENLAVEKRVADAEARAERAEQLATMTDVQKAHYGTLSPEAQAEFLSSTSEDRQGAVEKAAGDDPVVYTTLAGEDIRKSAGSLMLSVSKRADEMEKSFRAEKAAREHDTFAKRAATELNNLPGAESAQVALLKAVSGIPSEADRTAVEEILKAANSGISKAFETAGTTDGGSSEGADAEGRLTKMAQEYATANGASFSKSYRAVLETPEGRELYRQTR